MKLRHRLLTAGLAGLLLAPAGAASQTTQRFVSIVRLAQDGLVDSARAEMRRVLAEFPASDSLYPEALYTSAIVAASHGERRTALRRVIVEHSQSSWADDATLLMAQLEYADGNPAATVQQITRLIDDYPLSPLRMVGAFWGARAANDLRDGARGCRWADIGLAVPTSDVEIKAQLGFQKQRCQGLIAQQAEPARPGGRDTTPARQPTPAPVPARVPATPPAPARPDRGVFVQVAALDSEAAAEPVADRARRMNYPVVVVKEGQWYKVRVGPFGNRTDANAALRRVRETLGGQPFIVTVR
jgi:hypothetical protein